MNPVGYLAEGRRILTAPRIIIGYLCYTVIVSYAAEYILPVQIIATLLIEPLVFSFIAGRYFIDAVDPSRLAGHRHMRWRLYIPFVTIFGILFFTNIIGQSAYSWFYRHDVRVSVPLLALYGFLSTMVAFWMTATIFCRGNVWQGWRTALRLMWSNPVPGVLFFTGYFLFQIFHELYGFGTMKGVHALLFIVLHAAYAFFDLYATRVAIALGAAARYVPDPGATLDEYITGRHRAEQLPDQSLQVKKANVCLILGILSIVPGVHFFAMILGWKRFRSQESGRFRSIVGFILGAFFTALYCLAILGNMVTNEKRFAPLEHLSSLDVYMKDSAVDGRVRQIIQQLKSEGAVDHRALASRLESIREDRTQARYFALGLAYGYAYNSQQSLAAFKNCLELPGWSPEVLFHIGRINLFQTHDFFEARNNLARFLKYRPQDKTARLYVDLIDNRVAWDNNWIISLLSVIALLIAMTSHEFGHSYTAYKCGDPTPKEAGRMSLNPIVHLDLFGSIILPAFLILSRSGIIVGWAKPVPVNPDNFKDPKRDSTLVSVMGCFTNFSIALAATVALALVSVIVTIIVPDFVSIHWLYPADVISVAGLPLAKFWAYFAIFLSLLIMINIAIGIFNLIPIPPLDGSWIVEHRLRLVLKQRYAAYQQFSFLLILILLFTNVIDVIIGSVLNAYFMCVQVILAPALNLT